MKKFFLIYRKKKRGLEVSVCVNCWINMKTEDEKPEWHKEWSV